MKKTMKKLLPLLLAVVMCLAFAGAALAAVDMSTYNSTVTVSGITQGNTLKLYKLADATIGDDNTLSYSFVSGMPTAYDSVEEITADNVNLTDMANVIAAVYGGKAPTYSAAAGSDSTAVIQDVTPGWYYAIVSGTNDTTVVYQNMLINTTPTAGNTGWTTTNPTSEVKKQDETIVKTVGTAPNAETTDGYSVGDDVPFTLTTTIPNYPADSTQATFVIGDEPSGATLYDVSGEIYTVSVNGDNTSYHAATTDIIDSMTVSSNKLTISFNKAYILAHPGAAVTVTYNAKLTGDPAADGKTAENTATITFNPNPYENSTVEPGDTTKVFTYGYVFDKVDDQNQPLENAVFTLYTDSTCTTPAVNAAGDAITSTSTKVGNKAYVYFTGLKAGTFYAKETTTPAGYKALANPVTVTVSETTSKADNPATTEVTESNFTVQENSVQNVKGTNLPSTGGIGTTIFYIAGSALVLVAGAALFARRVARKQS